MNSAKQIFVIIILCLFLAMIDTGCGGSNETVSGHTANSQTATVKEPSPVTAPIADKNLVDEVSKVNADGKYAFVLFYSDDNENAARLRKTVESVKGKLEPKAHFLEAKISAPSSRHYVQKYNLDRAPMPLLMAFAPNGVALRALQAGCSAEDIEKSFVSPKTAEVFKAIQEGENTLLLFGNDGLEGFRDSLLSANKVALVWPNLRIIVVDPTDPEEKNLLEQSKVSSETNRSVLLVLSTTGTIGARIEGKVTEKEITDAIGACRSQCG